MEPITRRETLLNQIADNTSGNAGSIDMEPITREEVYLKQIADNTASGGGGGSAPSGGIVVLHKDESTGALDKTWNEIRTLYEAGIPLYFVWEGTQFEVEIRAAFVDMVVSYSGMYFVSLADGLLSFVASAANDYPVLDEG